MKIYVSHSSAYDYETELYAPLRTALGETYDVFLPHDDGRVDGSVDAASRIRQSDLVIAEVSLPSTGQGIEIGWANAAGVPIVGIHKKGTRYSSALKSIGMQPLAYDSIETMIERVTDGVARLGR